MVKVNKFLMAAIIPIALVALVWPTPLRYQ